MPETTKEIDRPIRPREVPDPTDGEPMMRHFSYKHLPSHLRDVSIRFYSLAAWVVDTQPRTAERTVALRKLLEAKDCAVRNVVDTTRV